MWKMQINLVTADPWLPGRWGCLGRMGSKDHNGAQENLGVSEYVHYLVYDGFVSVYICQSKN